MLQNLVKSLGSFWFYGWVFDMEASFRMMLTFLSKSLAHGSGLFIFKLLHIENWNTQYSAGTSRSNFLPSRSSSNSSPTQPQGSPFVSNVRGLPRWGEGIINLWIDRHITFVMAAVSFERVFRIWTVRSFLFQLYPSLCPYRVSI